MTNARVGLARGAVRETLTAIHNLAELLRSRRVASRALASAVGDAREVVATVANALGDLERAAREPLATDVALSSSVGRLFDETRVRAQALADEIVRMGTAPFDARHRIALEQLLRSVAAIVETALVVTDVLEALRDERPTLLDVSELLRERWRAPRASDSAVPIRLDIPAAPPCVADARILGPLIDFAAGLVALRSGDVLAVTIDRERSSSALRISASRPPRGTVRAARNEPKLGSRRHHVPEELALAIAERGGFALTMAADRRTALVGLEKAGC